MNILIRIKNIFTNKNNTKSNNSHIDDNPRRDIEIVNFRCHIIGELTKKDFETIKILEEKLKKKRAIERK